MKAGWKRKSLGNQFKTATGSTPSKSNPAFFGGTIPLVKPPELLDGEIVSAADSLTELGAAETRLLPIDSILVSCIGILGKIGIARVPVSFNQQINAILPKPDEADPKFMFYQALSPDFRDQLFARSSGTTVAIVNKSKFNEIEIVLPPLDEQRRIVAVLDKAFAGIATARANAQRNLTNARALFEGYLEAQLRDCTGAAEDTDIGSEVDFSFGFAFKSNGYTADPAGIPLLRGDNIVNGALRWDGVVRWPNGDADTYRAFALQSGDVVLAMDRTWVKSGLKFAVIHDEDLPLLQVQRVARMRCRPSLLNSFLSYQIESPAFTSYIIGIQTGLGVPHISGKQIAAFKFLKPSLPEQKKLVEQLDRLKENAVSLETAYRNKLAALTELKQSLLQKAFAGELT